VCALPPAPPVLPQTAAISNLRNVGHLRHQLATALVESGQVARGVVAFADACDWLVYLYGSRAEYVSGCVAGHAAALRSINRHEEAAMVEADLSALRSPGASLSLVPPRPVALAASDVLAPWRALGLPLSEEDERDMDGAVMYVRSVGEAWRGLLHDSNGRAGRAEALARMHAIVDSCGPDAHRAILETGASLAERVVGILEGGEGGKGGPAAARAFLLMTRDDFASHLGREGSGPGRDEYGLGIGLSPANWEDGHGNNNGGPRRSSPAVVTITSKSAAAQRNSAPARAPGDAAVIRSTTVSLSHAAPRALPKGAARVWAAGVGRPSVQAEEEPSPSPPPPLLVPVLSGQEGEDGGRSASYDPVVEDLAFAPRVTAARRAPTGSAGAPTPRRSSDVSSSRWAMYRNRLLAVLAALEAVSEAPVGEAECLLSPRLWVWDAEQKKAAERLEGERAAEAVVEQREEAPPLPAGPARAGGGGRDGASPSSSFIPGTLAVGLLTLACAAWVIRWQKGEGAAPPTPPPPPRQAVHSGHAKAGRVQPSSFKGTSGKGGGVSTPSTPSSVTNTSLAPAPAAHESHFIVPPPSAHGGTGVARILPPSLAAPASLGTAGSYVLPALNLPLTRGRGGPRPLATCPAPSPMGGPGTLGVGLARALADSRRRLSAPPSLESYSEPGKTGGGSDGRGRARRGLGLSSLPRRPKAAVHAEGVWDDAATTSASLGGVRVSPPPQAKTGARTAVPAPAPAPATPKGGEGHLTEGSDKRGGRGGSKGGEAVASVSGGGGRVMKGGSAAPQPATKVPAPGTPRLEGRGKQRGRAAEAVAKTAGRRPTDADPSPPPSFSPLPPEPAPAPAAVAAVAAEVPPPVESSPSTPPPAPLGSLMSRDGYTYSMEIGPQGLGWYLRGPTPSEYEGWGGGYGPPSTHGHAVSQYGPPPSSAYPPVVMSNGTAYMLVPAPSPAYMGPAGPSYWPGGPGPPYGAPSGYSYGPGPPMPAYGGPPYMGYRQAPHYSGPPPAMGPRGSFTTAQKHSVNTTQRVPPPGRRTPPSVGGEGGSDVIQ